MRAGHATVGLALLGIIGGVGCKQTNPAAAAGSQTATPALVIGQSPHSAQETMTRLKKAVEGKGLTVFALIDHAKNAQGAGLSLPPTQVLLFGNPKLGTPMMQAGRTAGIDLPQRVLVWEEGGATKVAYQNVDAFKGRHGLGDLPQLDKVRSALAGLVKAATAK